MGITVGIIIVTYNRCDVTGMMISKGKHVQNGQPTVRCGKPIGKSVRKMIYRRVYQTGDKRFGEILMG